LFRLTLLLLPGLLGLGGLRTRRRRSGRFRRLRVGGARARGAQRERERDRYPGGPHRHDARAVNALPPDQGSLRLSLRVAELDLAAVVRALSEQPERRRRDRAAA